MHTHEYARANTDTDTDTHTHTVTSLITYLKPDIPRFETWTIGYSNWSFLKRSLIHSFYAPHKCDTAVYAEYCCVLALRLKMCNLQSKVNYDVDEYIGANAFTPCGKAMKEKVVGLYFEA